MTCAITFHILQDCINVFSEPLKKKKKRKTPGGSFGVQLIVTKVSAAFSCTVCTVHAGSASVSHRGH